MSQQQSTSATSQEAPAPRNRRPYAAPVVERVPLRPEEAVLGACKNVTAGSGPRQPSSCRMVSACSAIGS
jgi:hypothetical protein